ncbi:MAG: hypothetical protein Tsb005_20710 [Gammaproteobacteria bacterium]
MRFDSLSARFGIGYIIVVATLVLFGLFTMWSTNQLFASVHRTLSVIDPSSSAVSQLQISLNRALVKQRDMLLSSNNSDKVIYLTLWQQSIVVTVDQLQSKLYELDDVESLVLFRRIQEAVQDLDRYHNQLAGLSVRDRENILQLVNEQISPKLAQLQVMVTGLTQHLTFMREKITNDIEQRLVIANQIDAALFGIGIIGSILFGWFTLQSIIRPTRNVWRFAHAIAEGNLNSNVHLKGPREIRQLGEALNNMMVELRESQLKNIEATRLLRESELKSRAIVDNAVDGMLTINNKGIIQTFNKAAEKIFGYSRHEVIGQNVRMLMPANYRREHDKYINNYLKTGVAKVIGSGREVTGLRKDGKQFPLSLAIGELNLEYGRYFIGVVRDITKEKQAENSLMHRNQELEEQNKIRAGRTGLNVKMRGELCLKNLAKNVTNFLAKFCEAQMAAFYIANHGRLELLISYACKTKVLPKTIELGEGLLGECAVQKELLIIKNIPDNYLNIVSSLGETRPEQLMLVPIVVDDNIIAVVEFATIHNFSAHQMKFIKIVSFDIGVALQMAINRDRLQELLEQTQRQSEELHAKQETLRLNNEVLEKQANELVQANHYKSTFLANMSHELRTPLNSLLILAEVLANNKQGNLTAEQLDSINVMRSSGKNLLDIINDILDLSKVEAGMLTIRSESIILQEVIDAIHDQFSPVADRKQLQFEIKQDENLPRAIYTDRLRVEQIVRNLLSNAFKFTEKGKVLLQVLRDKDFIIWRVQDTGIGVPLDKQEAIFEAFQQADGSDSRKYGGTGLGLTISRELSSMLKGYLKFDSIEGEGSCFEFYLPIGTADVATSLELSKVREMVVPKTQTATEIDFQQQLNEESMALSKYLVKRKVLLVNKDMRTSYALSEALENLGLEVLMADSQESATKKLTEISQVDVVLLNTNDEECCSENLDNMLNQHDAIKHIPVVAITDQHEQPSFDKFKPLNVRAHISNPLNINILVKTIHDQLRLSH